MAIEPDRSSVFAADRGAPADQGGDGRTWGVDDMPAKVAEWTRTTYRPYPYLSGDGYDDGSQQGRVDRGL